MMDDAVQLEVFKHLFASVAEEMGVRLQRSAFSPNIKKRRDYSDQSQFWWREANPLFGYSRDGCA